MLSKVLIGILLSFGIIGYFYYSTTQNQLIELRDLNKAYELKIETQDDAINTMQQSYELQGEALNELSLKNQEIQSEMNRYLDIFKRHNLAKLAAAKPGLIEKRVNGATKDVFDSLENDSSFDVSPTTE
jgi:type II secretory pathway pseudopilin PulG|tara:strand:+ start:355 stop:741 length:387 start_codon:yes stop_codon:yes gene_type:complete